MGIIAGHVLDWECPILCRWNMYTQPPTEVVHYELFVRGDVALPWHEVSPVLEHRRHVTYCSRNFAGERAQALHDLRDRLRALGAAGPYRLTTRRVFFGVDRLELRHDEWLSDAGR